MSENFSEMMSHPFTDLESPSCKQTSKKNLKPVTSYEKNNKYGK